MKAIKITTTNLTKLLFSFVQSAGSHLEARLITLGLIRPSSFMRQAIFSPGNGKAVCPGGRQYPLGSGLLSVISLCRIYFQFKFPQGSNSTEASQLAPDKKIKSQKMQPRHVLRSVEGGKQTHFFASGFLRKIFLVAFSSFLYYGYYLIIRGGLSTQFTPKWNEHQSNFLQALRPV